MLVAAAGCWARISASGVEGSAAMCAYRAGMDASVRMGRKSCLSCCVGMCAKSDSDASVGSASSAPLEDRGGRADAPEYGAAAADGSKAGAGADPTQKSELQ